MGNACTREDAAAMHPMGAQLFDTYQQTMEENKSLVSSCCFPVCPNHHFFPLFQRQKNKKLKATVDEHEQQLKRNEIASEEAERAYALLSEQFQQCQTELNSLQTDYERKAKKVEKLERKNADLTAQINELQQRINALQNQREGDRLAKEQELNETINALQKQFVFLIFLLSVLSAIQGRGTTTATTKGKT